MNSDSTICRVCLLSDKNAYCLTQKNEIKEYTLLEMFNACTHLKALEEDGLPQFICYTCSHDLQIAFDFLNRAALSDQILKTEINNVKRDEVVYYDSDQDNNMEFHLEESIIQSTKLQNENETEDEEASETLDALKVEIETVDHQQDFDQHYEQLDEDELVADDYENSINENKTTDHEIVKDEENETDDDAKNIKPQICSKQKTLLEKSNETSVKCGNCDKILKPLSLRHHLKRCQKEDRPYLCSSCPKSFAVQSDLRNHMRIHDKQRQRKYKCVECGKGFFEKQPLQVHMTRHMGIKEHYCKLCPKKFATKKSLEAHEFTHNRELGRFQCKHCDKRFPSRADLTVHERFHTGDYPYQCEYCEKSFAVKSHYNYHLAKHKGVTYKCNECDKEFTNRGSLIAHRYKHKDRMPHECSICKKGFTSPFKLNRHKSCHKPKD